MADEKENFVNPAENDVGDSTAANALLTPDAGARESISPERSSLTSKEASPRDKCTPEGDLGESDALKMSTKSATVSPSSHKDKEEKVRQLREKQLAERRAKLEELKKAQEQHRLHLKQQEEARRRKIEDMKIRDEQRRKEVEERRNKVLQAEMERLASIMKKNAERESKINETRRSAQPKIAFGSSLPRMPDERSRSRGRRNSWEFPLTSNKSESLSPPISKRMSQSVSILTHRRRNMDTSLSSSNSSSPALRKIPEANKTHLKSPSTPALGPSTKAVQISNRLYQSSTQASSSRHSRASPGVADVKSASSFTAASKRENNSIKSRSHTANAETRSKFVTTKSRESRSTSRGSAPQSGRTRSAEGQKRKKPEDTRMVQSVYGTLGEKETAVKKRVEAREAKKTTPRAISAPPRPPKKDQKALEKVPPVPKRVPKKPVASVSEKKNKSPTPPQSRSPQKATSPVPDGEKDTPSGKITSEEEAKARLAEKRREAREKAEREAELNRQHQEQLRIEEEERIKREEEERARWEEEQIRLAEEARILEEERLQKAIADEEKRKEEEQRRKEEESREKADAEQKAREEMARLQKEIEERARKEEEDRLARKKKLDAIMSRTRKTPNTTPAKTDDTAEAETANDTSSRASDGVVSPAPSDSTITEQDANQPTVTDTDLESAKTSQLTEIINTESEVTEYDENTTVVTDIIATEESSSRSTPSDTGVIDSDVWDKQKDIMSTSMYAGSTENADIMTMSMYDSGLPVEENGQDITNGYHVDVSEKHNFETKEKQIDSLAEFDHLSSPRSNADTSHEKNSAVLCDVSDATNDIQTVNSHHLHSGDKFSDNRNTDFEQLITLPPDNSLNKNNVADLLEMNSELDSNNCVLPPQAPIIAFEETSQTKQADLIDIS